MTSAVTSVFIEEQTVRVCPCSLNTLVLRLIFTRLPRSTTMRCPELTTRLVFVAIVRCLSFVSFAGGSH
ncbi:MAG: hypothetical protein EOO65_00555 [Methanosarcinales archaeon]|nr:MAG: hypothetical protein EOO65_00555 [Methanosarcinales archaeon]